MLKVCATRAEYRAQMNLGLDIASAGMLAEQVREDQLANDLANASTPGFKAASSVQHSFGDLLLHNTLTGQNVGVIQDGVALERGVTDLAQGPLEPTGNPLDFALVGPGFFAVRTPAGVQYTRNGRFSASAQGLLVDQFGHDVLAQNGSPIRVGRSGAVPARALGVFALRGARQLGNDNFSGTVAGRGAGTVQTGELEGSGVDPIQAMVQMESALDAYTAGQQTIATIGQTMQESASNVGSIP